MAADHRQHLRCQLKHVSMNNWNYKEYIQVVTHYLTNNYEKLYHDLYDICLKLLVLSDFDSKNRESCQLKNAFYFTSRSRSRYEADLSVYVLSFISSSLG